MSADNDDLGTLPSLILLRQELVDAAEREPTRRWGPWRWLTGLFVVGAIAVSPLGAAIADGIADLVGIGGQPSDTRPRTAIVIGDVTSAVPFEIVATGAEPGRVVPPGEEPIPSVAPEFPSVQVAGPESCLTPQAQDALGRDAILPLVYGAPAELAPNGPVAVQGFADSDVSRAEVFRQGPEGGDGSLAVAELAELTPELSAQIRVDSHTRFFVVFVSPADVAPTGSGGRFTQQDAHRALAGLVIQAYGAGGELLSEQSLDLNRHARTLSLSPPG
jgi:hypothetical protein